MTDPVAAPAAAVHPTTAQEALVQLPRVPRPSPALGLAAIALLVALGGTGVAAVTALAPANTVGSAAVIDGSLQRKDMKPGVIPTAANKTKAYAVTVPTAELGTSSSTVASLQIPEPGSYVIIGKSRLTAASEVAIRCKLAAGDDVDEPWPVVKALEKVQVTSVLTHAFATAGTITFGCTSTGTATAAQTRIVALKVDDLTAF